MKKVLVTGSKGQLGRSLAEHVSKFPEITLNLTDVDELDITSMNALTQFFNENQFDFVINCAAYTAVDKAEEDPEKAQLLNATAVKYLAGFSRRYGFRLIHISTDYVFDGRNYRPYTENDEPKPNGVYAKSKNDGEKEALRDAPQLTIIRTSWLYSEYGHNFLKTILRLAEEKDEIRVVSDQIGTPTFAGDLADAILTMIHLDYGEKRKEIFHFTNLGIASWYDFAKEIIDQSGLNCHVVSIKTEDYPLPAPRPFYSVLSKEKFISEFQYTILHWKEGLVRCLEKLR